jgi:hypothetical protein
MTRCDRNLQKPDQRIEQTTIVAEATGVFHESSQVKFAKVTRLEGKDFARWQPNMVNMKLRCSYNVYTVRRPFGHPSQLVQKRKMTVASWMPCISG